MATIIAGARRRTDNAAGLAAWQSGLAERPINKVLMILPVNML